MKIYYLTIYDLRLSHLNDNYFKIGKYPSPLVPLFSGNSVRIVPYFKHKKYFDLFVRIRCMISEPFLTYKFCIVCLLSTKHYKGSWGDKIKYKTWSLLSVALFFLVSRIETPRNDRYVIFVLKNHWTFSQLNTINSLSFITVQAVWARQSPLTDTNVLSYLLDIKLKEPKTFNYSYLVSMMREPIWKEGQHHTCRRTEVNHERFWQPHYPLYWIGRKVVLPLTLHNRFQSLSHLTSTCNLMHTSKAKEESKW